MQYYVARILTAIRVTAVIDCVAAAKEVMMSPFVLALIKPHSPFVSHR
jgi:hypothetical protein